MLNELTHIKRRTASVIGRLEGTLFAAAEEVKSLKQTYSGQYADAILYGNMNNIVEVHFTHFAPSGSPMPHHLKEFLGMKNAQEYKEYKQACYDRWVKGIQSVQRIVSKYGGWIEAGGVRLDHFLSMVSKNGEIPTHISQVRMCFPEQDKLSYLLRAIK